MSLHICVILFIAWKFLNKPIPFIVKKIVHQTLFRLICFFKKGNLKAGDRKMN